SGRAWGQINQGALMNTKQTTVSLEDGTQATLILSEPVTPQRIPILEEALSRWLHSLPRQAQLPSDAGAVEYDSWLSAGTLEYASWRNAF
ncbi:MAG TPA: hypothetical protein VFK32_09540, partial [Tepidiformaceae bacterium]|nr:hypothetical protein [Tepidiformaceae bacterium]